MGEERKILSENQLLVDDELSLFVAQQWGSILPQLVGFLNKKVSRNWEDVKRKQRLEVLLQNIVLTTGFKESEDFYSDEFETCFKGHLARLAASSANLSEKTKSESDLLEENKKLKENLEEMLAWKENLEETMQKFARGSKFPLETKFSLSDLKNLEAHVTAKLENEVKLSMTMQQAVMLFGKPLLNPVASTPVPPRFSEPITSRATENTATPTKLNGTPSNRDSAQERPIKRRRTYKNEEDKENDDEDTPSNGPSTPQSARIGKRLVKAPERFQANPRSSVPAATDEAAQVTGTPRLSPKSTRRDSTVENSLHRSMDYKQQTKAWNFQCDSCRKFFYHKSDLESHIKGRTCRSERSVDSISNSSSPSSSPSSTPSKENLMVKGSSTEVDDN